MADTNARDSPPKEDGPKPDRKRRDDDLRSDDDSKRDRTSRRHRDSSRDRRDRYRDRSESDGERRDRHRRRRHDRSSERSHRRGDDKDKHASRDERRRRERSTSRERSHHRRRSRSPPSKKPRRTPSVSASPPPKRSRAPLPSQNEEFTGESGEAPPPEKLKPNFKPTGLLAKEANTVAGTSTVLKYHEPPEARKPSSKEQWRMYVFKKKDLVDTMYICQRSVWLIGRDQSVTDLYLEHPSISKQHAVIQFRHRTTTNEFGDKKSKVKPYLIDLESANGTKLNGKKIDASRYVELVDADVVTFGDSEREYVLMLPPPE